MLRSSSDNTPIAVKIVETSPTQDNNEQLKLRMMRMSTIKERFDENEDEISADGDLVEDLDDA